MPIQVLNYKDGRITASYNRSPLVTVFTDADSFESIPDDVRGAADRLVSANVDPLKNSRVPEAADGALVWLQGDQLIEGSVAGLRKNLRTPGRRTFVPVHYPYLDEAELIVLQPRLFAKGMAHDYWGFNFRLRNQLPVSEKVLAALRSCTDPWSRLSLAVAREIARPGAGAEGLAALWQAAPKLPVVLAALALRNLAVVLMRHQKFTEAGQLLEQGIARYPGCAELPYLAALLCLREGQPAKTARHIEKMTSASRAYIGSGGESTYRLSWLLGLQEVRSGNEREALHHLMVSAAGHAFVPAAEELLKLRVPNRIVERSQWQLCRLARRKPELVEKTVEFFVRHRAFDAARRLIETVELGPERREVLRERLERGLAPFGIRSGLSGRRTGLILEGPFFEQSSLARINREIGTSLIQDAALDVALEPTGYASNALRTLPGADLLDRALNRTPEHLDLTIRHRWPPDFSRPARGKLAVIFPWEYGAVPRIWVEQINRNVDEVWVPSRFVRDVLVRSRVDARRVVVLPNGIDASLFKPEGRRLRPTSVRSFVFLFVGGAIRRKGIDLLLDAYREAFDAGDDVSLLVTALGSQAAYRHNSLIEKVLSESMNSSAPHVELLTGDLDDATLASLYRGCDTFVIPYRAEGFCMPALEAMACGKPVITTADGPSQDFCSPATEYLIPGRQTVVPEDPPAFGELAGEFTWFEPDIGELVRAMRTVYQNRDEAARRGRAAAQRVRARFAWPQITKIYQERVKALTVDAGDKTEQLDAA